MIGLYVFIVLSLAIFANWACHKCCQRRSYFSYRFQQFMQQRQHRQEWEPRQWNPQEWEPQQVLPTTRTRSEVKMDAERIQNHRNRARLLPSNIDLADAADNLEEQTKTERKVMKQIGTQLPRNVTKDCSICLAALEQSENV